MKRRDETFAAQLGRRLQVARARLGISQPALAMLVGATRQSVSNWERGTASPKSHHLAALSEELRVSSDWLLTGRERALERLFIAARLGAAPALPDDDGGGEDWDVADVE